MSSSIQHSQGRGQKKTAQEATANNNHFKGNAMDFNNHDMRPEIIERLISEHSFKDKGDFLQQGRCPSPSHPSNLKKNTLWTSKESPWYIKCNHASKCGFEAKINDFLPDLYENLGKKHPPTPENPNATADRYLQIIRGFDISRLRGFYEQGSVEDYKSGKFYPTVKFWLDKEKGDYWERLIEGERDYGRPSNFPKGSKVAFWQPPTQSINDFDTVYVTEAIIKSLALFLNNKKTVAAMSSGFFDKDFFEAHKGKNIHWIYAFDNDKAGKKGALKAVKLLEEMGEKVSAVLPEYGSDWDDLHKIGRLQEESWKKYEYLGSLLLAKTAMEKALLMNLYKESRMFTFRFKGCTYGFKLDYDKYVAVYDRILEEYEKKPEFKDSHLMDEDLAEVREKAIKESGTLQLLAKFTIDYLYSQREPDTNSLFYYIRLKRENGKEGKDLISSQQLISAPDFTKRLPDILSLAIYKASKEHHISMIDEWLTKDKTVDALPYVGYSAAHAAYAFPDYAVKDGKIYHANDEDYIDVGKVALKSCYHGIEIKNNLNPEEYNDEWFNDMVGAWGTKSLIVLAYWVGSLFVQQIRAKHESYPFLEMVGDPGTGKTSFIKMLWRLFGRAGFEGFNPRANKGTNSYLTREMIKVRNLPTVLTEGDKGETDQKNNHGVDWTDYKDFYTGEGVRGTAKKTNGNETKNPKFHSGLVIAQNHPVQSDKAVMERICQVYFKSEDNDGSTLMASRRLFAFNADDISYFMPKVLLKEKEIMETFLKLQPKFEAKFLENEAIKTQRLTLTHSQLAALVGCLRHVVNVSDEQVREAQIEIKTMAEEREISMQREHPLVEQFFENVMALQDKMVGNNHKGINHSPKSKADQRLSIDLTEYWAHCKNFDLPLPMDILILKEHLKMTKRLIGQSMPVNSGITNKSKRCWVFGRMVDVARKEAA